MIRVTITLIPAGVDDLAKEISHVDIGCAFPLDPANQNFYIFQGMNYAEIIGYDANTQPDDEAGWWNFVHDCLTQLRTNGIRRAGGEFIPGMMAMDPTTFDEIMNLLIENYGPAIKYIKMWGERAKNPEKFTNMGFIKATNKFAEEHSALTGKFLFANWPDYQGYHLAIKLDPKLYQSEKVKMGTKHFANQGLMIEKAISLLSLREMPREEKLFCNNGIVFYFMRPYPDGSIYNYYDHGDDRKYKNMMNAGNTIYDWREGLYKYPGKSIPKLPDKKQEYSQLVEKNISTS